MSVASSEMGGGGWGTTKGFVCVSYYDINRKHMTHSRPAIRMLVKLTETFDLPFVISCKDSCMLYKTIILMYI